MSGTGFQMNLHLEVPRGQISNLFNLCGTEYLKDFMADEAGSKIS